MSQLQIPQRQLLFALVGDECEYCEGGTLVRERYKGNEAVVCEGCGTPAAQVW